MKEGDTEKILCSYLLGREIDPRRCDPRSGKECAGCKHNNHPLSKNQGGKDMSQETLEEDVGGLPPNGAWWKKSGEETFLRIAKQLLKKGFSEDETLNILGECYAAVSAEFGL